MSPFKLSLIKICTLSFSLLSASSSIADTNSLAMYGQLNHGNTLLGQHVEGSLSFFNSSLKTIHITDLGFNDHVTLKTELPLTVEPDKRASIQYSFQASHESIFKDPNALMSQGITSRDFIQTSPFIDIP